jgi:hypothetical protein
LQPVPPTSQSASGSTAVLEYRPTETLPVLGAMLLDLARLCRRCRPRMAAKMAENPRLSWDGGEIWRETDCLLERNGFELPVPRENGYRSALSISLKLFGFRRRNSSGTGVSNLLPSNGESANEPRSYPDRDHV